MQGRAKGRRAGWVVARETSREAQSAAGPGASVQGLRLGSQLSGEAHAGWAGHGRGAGGQHLQWPDHTGVGTVAGGDLTSPWPLKQNAPFFVLRVLPLLTHSRGRRGRDRQNSAETYTLPYVK